MNHIGQYEILGILGGGGMGTVYKARDPRFDSPVAIKVLHPHFQLDPEVARRFRAEAVIQRKLNHPNIVTVFDFVADSSGRAFVMEYLDGVTLEALIERNGGPLVPERAARLADQMLSAMAHAHAQGLVHRDVKPANIMIQRFGSDEVVKVMDFGIAKIFGMEAVRTATSAKMGTLAYMSPEHSRNPRSFDARSDVFSLGIVLYEMLAARLPFDADSEYELTRQIVTLDVPPLPRVGARGLDTVVRKATAKLPADRFQNCGEFREGLRVALQAPATSGVERLVPAARFASTQSRSTQLRLGQRTGEQRPPLPVSNRIAKDAEPKRSSEEAARRRIDAEAQPRSEAEARRQLDEGTRQQVERERVRRDAGVRRQNDEETWEQDAQQRTRRDAEAKERGEANARRGVPDQERSRELSPKAFAVLVFLLLAAAIFGLIVLAKGGKGESSTVASASAEEQRAEHRSLPATADLSIKARKRRPDQALPGPRVSDLARTDSGADGGIDGMKRGSSESNDAPSASRHELQPLMAAATTVGTEPIQPAKAEGSGAALRWKRIQSGSFSMGCVEGDPECERTEMPVHQVTISRGFAMAETETTNGQYRTCVEQGQCEAPGRWQGGDDYPVVTVNWNAAVAFCRWTGGRLPTEAEWEYAARGGRGGSKFPWGNSAAHENANYRGMEGRDRWNASSPVKSFEPNGYGLFDMAGNVWEWVADWYDPDFYPRLPSVDPAGPATGTQRVLRGGSSFDSVSFLRTSLRFRGDPGVSDASVGFRCARD